MEDIREVETRGLETLTPALQSREGLACRFGNEVPPGGRPYGLLAARRTFAYMFCWPLLSGKPF
jgi:hypothetical protein